MINQSDITLGFNADVFLGEMDGNKYTAESNNRNNKRTSTVFNTIPPGICGTPFDDQNLSCRARQMLQ